MSNFDMALERVLALNFEIPKYKHTEETSLLLFKEYLRRKLLWTQALNIEGWPHVDLARGIDSSVEIPQDIQDRLLHLILPGAYVRIECYHYLKWALVSEYPKALSINLPPPYETVMKFIEGGGSYFRAHNSEITLMNDQAGLYHTIWPGSLDYLHSEPFISDDAM